MFAINKQARKSITTILLPIIILWMVVCAHAYDGSRSTFTFTNDTDCTMVYLLYWVDHDLDRSQFPGPVNLAGGELAPGKSNTLDYKYRSGKYIISWRVVRSVGCDDNIYHAVVQPSTTKVFLYPYHFDALVEI